MRDAQPVKIFLKDYQVPAFLIERTDLAFELLDSHTVVTAALHIVRNPESNDDQADLVLDGQQLDLQSVNIDGQLLASSQYAVDDESLTITDVPKQFVLTTVVHIKPRDNTSLEGLYRSSSMYCTQCEAEGFRKITYYLDRPDVMSLFTTKIIADKKAFPVLLSNGNLTESCDLIDGRHYTVWEDPFKKPAYLFALVAGDLQFIEDKFTTMNGRDVTLRIFVEEKDIDKCDHAMASLIASMKWDEEVYGREYDLNIFNIVAVDDFNMGAMENKSLNIFNTSCVLARPETTTDGGFQRVEAVVAHEYFHNWSGNRVTCRDWFQLSLKEGFTVFRDAQFSSDMGSPTVKRVEDVTMLRNHQFPEDAGPMAHPIRPDSFIEISNFYTVTIYEKGAEVVRMIRTLLGADNFRKGSDLYFDRHDGQAVTCEDFVKAMEDASGVDLRQFRNWYSQAGTPVLDIQGDYNAEQQSYTLTVEQSCPATPGQETKQPFLIPLQISLLGDAGAYALKLQGEEPNVESADNTERVLSVTEAKQQFVFENIAEQPVPSLLRSFSAPVRINFPYSRENLLFLMRNDNDGFCRWDAAQQLGLATIAEVMQQLKNDEAVHVDESLIEAYRSLLENNSLDKAMVALMLELPSISYLIGLHQPADVPLICKARNIVRLSLAEALEPQLWVVYRNNRSNKAYQANAEQIAQRSLKNTALAYLMLLEDKKDAINACMDQYQEQANMTDVAAALQAIVNSSFGEQKLAVLNDFYERWKHEPLVVNLWFSVQAAAQIPASLERVKQLMAHPAFDIKNPNKVRSVLGAFAGQNYLNFHQEDGSGYQFLAEQIIVLDKLNPQMASRLVAPLSKWQQYAPAYAEQMKKALQMIIAEESLSKDVYEVVSKSLD